MTVPAPRRSAPGPELTLVTPPPAMSWPEPKDPTRVAEYDALNFPLICLAENLNDLESARIAMSHRRGALERAGATMAELAVVSAVADQLLAVELYATKELVRAMKAHPLGPWVTRTKGVGHKQAGRLLAAIGNPYWNSLADRPRRGPAELWAYCGYHVIDGRAPRHARGHRSNWNASAKSRAYLVATSCMKVPVGEYRPLYESARERYAELPKGHAHNRALRLVAKAVLRDIWREAAAWHEPAE